jgi:hypothetical protein
MCNKDSVAFVISILLEDFITRWMKITICDIFHLYISMLLMVRSYLYTVVTDLIYQRGMWCLFISVYRRYRSHLSEGSVMFVYICIPSLQISFIRGECDVCLYLYTVVTDLIYQRGVGCLFISVYRRYRSHLSEGSGIKLFQWQYQTFLWIQLISFLFQIDFGHVDANTAS